MSRSFRDLMKFSVPALLSASLLSGCGSGSSGSADLGKGDTVTPPPPAVTATETFDFESATDWFVSGTPPTHARFSGGKAEGNGAWIVPSGETGVVDFGTPADTVIFSTQDNYAVAAPAGAGAQKTGGTAARQAVTNKFSVPMFFRGIGSDWTTSPERQFQPHSCIDNVLVLRLELGPDIVEDTFKIADEDWTDATNCGKNDDSDLVTVDTPYNMVCRGGLGFDAKFTIPSQNTWKFTFDARNENSPVLTITEDSPDDCDGDGGGGPPPNSTEIRVYGIDTLDQNAEEQLLTTLTDEGTGSISVDEIADRTGGSPRITRVEIENLGTAGDVGIEEFSWTADARFALDPVTVDISYTRPEASVAGTKIVVNGQTYDCVPVSAESANACVARGVEVTPYANTTMTVQNADGSTESIILNGGSGEEDVYAYSGSAYASTGEPSTAPVIANAAAHWVTADTLLFDPPAGTAQVELLASPDASIATAPLGFTGTYQTVSLTSGTNPQPAFNKELHNLQAWSLGASAANAKDIARGQLVAVARDSKGAVVGATRVQIAGALDDLYAEAAYDQPLGPTYASGVPSLAVWAPTALRDPGVSVNVYDAAGQKLETKPMTLDEETGIWKVEGTGDWDRKFYTISLQVYSYAADAIVSNEVTDPYSVSLAADSVRSQFVDLDDDDLKPGNAGEWDDMALPDLEAPEESVIYELHVRDFSSYDPDPAADSESDNLKDADRGKFTAFADTDFVGTQHLQQLKQAGLTHLHILPAFDIATVKENRSDRVEIDDPVEDLCAANDAAADLCRTDAGKTIRQAMADAVASGWLERPQQIVNWMRALDGFNWGYDPYHFGVPEGSYATNPDGEARIREFRAMVLGLNNLDLRLVMDVVYNHTNASGQNPKSVLDKVVPGYYHRRDNRTGSVLGDSCCDDTAAEFRMMEKLMIDTGVRWVRDYKVSGFRFDLMSFHPLESMTRFRDAVQDPANGGDPSVYIYGEGWNFGAIENDRRFTAARQANLGGTGIGSFSDRMRDPLKGGGCCDGGDELVKNQGFMNGWYYDPNSANTGSTAERQALIKSTDNIRVWLAGGLKDYQLQNAAGATVSGAGVDYSGQDSGYTLDPQEAINYVEKHDNQTLWDFGAYRHPDATSVADRVRAHNVGLAVILLSQGVPFVHAGSDILRSKSGDRDSYDSGDWFNELDWSLGGTKWAQGLPIADKNEPVWPILQGKYQTVMRPDQAAQQRAFEHVLEMLKIRKSSGLFRLRDAAQVEKRVKFHNTGPSQIPGVIAMEIDGCTNPNEPVPDRGAIVSIFNASDEAVTLPLFGSESWTLHPVLAVESSDAVVKTAKHDGSGFYVPARTTAVFERAEQNSCSPYPVDLYVRGSFTDWADPPLPAYKLNFLGGVDYAVSAPVTFPANFKIASADWNASAYDCGAAEDGASVLLGVPFTLTCGGSKNMALQGVGDGDYTFSLDATSTTNPVLTVSKSPAYAVPIYVRGVGTDWSDPPTAEQFMTPDPVEDLYRAVINVAAAGPDPNDGFKIASADWSTVDCGSSNPLTIGQPLTLVCASGTSNIAVNWPQTGTYFFALDTTNPSAPVLTVEKTPYDYDLYVRGVGTDWSDSETNKMTYLGNGIYRARRSATEGVDPDGGFKIAASDWSFVNCGSTNPLTVGQPLTLDCITSDPDNIAVTWPATGLYTFSLDATNSATPQLTVTGP